MKYDDKNKEHRREKQLEHHFVARIRPAIPLEEANLIIKVLQEKLDYSAAGANNYSEVVKGKKGKKKHHPDIVKTWTEITFRRPARASVPEHKIDRAKGPWPLERAIDTV